MADQSEPNIWMDEQLLLTAEEAARALRIGRTTLFGLIKNGDLHAVHIGRSCRLTRAELLRYVARLDRPTPSARPDHRASKRGGRTWTNQGGLFDLGWTPPDAA